MGTIRVSEETKAQLDERKHGEESFEAVIQRLVESDRERKRRQIAEGFGAWADGDAGGVARELRERSRREERARRAGRTDTVVDGSADGATDSETPGAER